MGFCHVKLRLSLICRGERFYCHRTEFLMLKSSNFVQLHWFHWAPGGSVKTKWSVNSNSTVQVVSQYLKNKANQRQLLGNAWVGKKIWTLQLGLLFSWRMPLKTRTSRDNLRIPGLWLTSFCSRILASLLHIKFAVSITTRVSFTSISIINICKVLWDSIMKILTVKRAEQSIISTYLIITTCFVLRAASLFSLFTSC